MGRSECLSTKIPIRLTEQRKPSEMLEAESEGVTFSAELGVGPG
jgi:hypothetical protein